MAHLPEEAHFTAWANRVYKAVFGKPVTANILRHAFISAIDVNRTSTAVLDATAARFGHSLATQIAYRRLLPSRKRKASSVDDGELLVALERRVRHSHRRWRQHTRFWLWLARRRSRGG